VPRLLRGAPVVEVVQPAGYRHSCDFPLGLNLSWIGRILVDPQMRSLRVLVADVVLQNHAEVIINVAGIGSHPDETVISHSIRALASILRGRPSTPSNSLQSALRKLGS
jgi:hypothetical protein